MQTEYVFSGFGGQGVMFAGQLLAYAAMSAEKQVTWIPSYGPEMRGGTAHCFVVISDSAIGSPIVAHPQIVVAFNNPSFDKYESVVAEGGLLLVNQSLVQQKSARNDIDVLYVPANEMAEELGSSRLANMVLLSAMLSLRPAISLETLIQTLNEYLPQHHRDMLPSNIAAIHRGADYAESHLFKVVAR